MTSYRRETQKPIGIYADVRFVQLLNAHLRKTRVSKSQFVRDAIAEKLAKEGVRVPEELIIPLPPYAERRASDELDELTRLAEEDLRRKKESGEKPAAPGDGRKVS